jgi:hypothetical protein
VGFRAGLDAVEKRISCPAGNRPRAVQTVARRYTEEAIPTRENPLKCYLHVPVLRPGYGCFPLSVTECTKLCSTWRLAKQTS